MFSKLAGAGKARDHILSLRREVAWETCNPIIAFVRDQRGSGNGHCKEPGLHGTGKSVKPGFKNILFLPTCGPKSEGLAVPAHILPLDMAE